MKVIEEDVVVIGAGLAGLYTALSIADNYRIRVLSKGDEDTSGSKFAQGGIAACIGKDDCFDYHVQDTLIAGNYYNDASLVEDFVMDGSQEVYRLMDYGVAFDQDEKGELLRTLEGGHSKKRVLHAHGDATGREIMSKIKLVVKARRNITWSDGCRIIKLLTYQSKVIGLEAVIEGQLVHVYCKKIVLATGGLGGLFMETTNPEHLFGEGLVMAYEAGASIRDVSLVQFHPTALYLKDSSQRFLITEAIRGEGGILKNRFGSPFMSKYDKRKELAPRDIVARAIYMEMLKTNSQYVWLDISHHNKKFLENRFPTIYSHLIKNGIAMEKDMIPVVPVAHYFVGGILVDYNGATTVENLYACGETSSTGIHGGNRLASNSLLECIVYGKRCGNHINESLKNTICSKGDISSEIMDYLIDPYDSMSQNIDKRANDGGLNISIDEMDDDLIQMVDELKGLMMEYVGIIRTDKGLKKALERIKDMEKQLMSKKQSLKWLETYRRIVAAKLMVEDGLTKDSIGCHLKKIVR